MGKGVEDVDNKFDKVERAWDRFQKLLLKIIGGVVGISLAIYIAYGQLKDKHEEHFEEAKIEQEKEKKKHEESVNESGDPTWTIIKKEFSIDPSGYRKGDTIYIDYYSDGYVEKYYTDNESYYED